MVKILENIELDDGVIITKDGTNILESSSDTATLSSLPPFVQTDVVSHIRFENNRFYEVITLPDQVENWEYELFLESEIRNTFGFGQEVVLVSGTYINEMPIFDLNNRDNAPYWTRQELESITNSHKVITVRNYPLPPSVGQDSSIYTFFFARTATNKISLMSIGTGEYTVHTFVRRRRIG